MSGGLRPALFLDRDGTLIADRGYLSDPAGVEILPGVPAALRAARAAGYRLYVLTNQSGVGRGMYTLEDVHRCQARMEELLGLPRPVFDGIGIAPETPDQPVVYRKPSPRFLLEMMARDGLDPARSWMAGDRPSDWEAGRNAGLSGVALLSGPEESREAVRQAAEAAGVPVFADLPALVRFLIVRG